MTVKGALRQSLLATAIALLLSACGGGGGDPGTPGGTFGTGGSGSGGSGSGGGSTTPPTTPVVTKYIGTWVRCVATNSTTSERETLALNRTDDVSLVFNDTLVDFNNSSCTGTGSGQSNSNGSIVFVGTKTIGTETVDEANTQATGGAPVQKQVFLIRPDKKLYLGVAAGNAGAVIDANGFPSTIDPNGFALQ